MKAAVMFALLLLAAAAAGAQDLLRSNPNYIKARQLQTQAEQAINQGEYDKAVELAKQSEKLIAQAEAETTVRIQQLRANSLKNQAGERIRYAKGINADVAYPDQWARANALYATAQKAYDAKDYQTSIDSSRAVLAVLAGIKAK